MLKAVCADDFETVRSLVESGRKLTCKDPKGNSLLHIAVTKNNFEIIALLLRQKKIIVNVRNLNEETPLFIDVKSGKLDVVQLLIKHNGNIHLATSKNVTPLHMSVPYPNITKLLLEKGAQVDTRDKNGETPLHMCITISGSP